MTESYKPKRKKTGGRQKGAPNKRTQEKLAAAHREATAPRRGKKLAIDHMDEMSTSQRDEFSLFTSTQSVSAVSLR